MYLSKYNIIKKINNETLIYNTKNAGVLKLNDEYTEEFENLLKNNESDKGDLIEALKQGSMLVDDNIDEKEILRIRYTAAKFNNQSLSLTIAPTMECNFACSYCYEEGYRHNTMNDKVQNSVIDFVKRRKDIIKNLSVSWYGGEPLLALDIIEKLTKSFLEITGEEINYSAGIVSNGYKLTRNVAKKLKDLKIKNIQVTLDGHKEIHNKRRMLLNGKGTFDKIINNIKNCYDIIPIHIRINVDRTNVRHLDSLIDTFEDFNLKNKINIYIAPVDDVYNKCSNNQCLTISEFSKEEALFLEKIIDRGYMNISIPFPSSSNCGAVNLNSFVIDPKGDLYKCWNHIGRENDKVGDVFTGTKLDKNLTKWILFDPFETENCSSCEFLPVCFGGCPFYKIVHGENKCRSIKYNAPLILKLFNKAKEMNLSVK